MNQDRSNQLDDLFAQAKDVPLLPSEERVHTIVNTGNGTSGRRLQKPNSRFTTTQGTTMTLTIFGLAGLLGIGALYLGPTEQPEPQRNSIAGAATQTAPQAFPQSTASPSVVPPPPHPALVQQANQLLHRKKLGRIAQQIGNGMRWRTNSLSSSAKLYPIFG